ncbi:hypothetical protein VP01_376g1 [Puccinia sorghi]|uniref:Uncharacterized protein n=1 Tax=Puccinia sorghi TaxID=27349 RepID=A0A0L6UVM5_9BASI|nr:hypothetical protein VP01_376g1 [Puccinia sorghi]
MQIQKKKRGYLNKKISSPEREAKKGYYLFLIRLKTGFREATVLSGTVFASLSSWSNSEYSFCSSFPPIHLVIFTQIFVNLTHFLSSKRGSKTFTKFLQLPKTSKGTFFIFFRNFNLTFSPFFLRFIQSDFYKIQRWIGERFYYNGAKFKLSFHIFGDQINCSYRARRISLVAHRILGDYLVLHIIQKSIFLKYDWTQRIPEETLIPMSGRVIKKGFQHTTHPLWIRNPQDVAVLVQVGHGTNFQYANGDLMIIISIATLFRVRNSMVKFVSPKKKYFNIFGILVNLIFFSHTFTSLKQKCAIYFNFNFIKSNKTILFKIVESKARCSTKNIKIRIRSTTVGCYTTGPKVVELKSALCRLTPKYYKTWTCANIFPANSVTTRAVSMALACNCFHINLLNNLQVELRMKLLVTCVDVKLNHQPNAFPRSICYHPSNMNSVKNHKENELSQFYELDIFFYVMITLRMWIKALHYSASTGSITPENSHHESLKKPLHLSQTIRICSVAWLPNNLMVKFMILLHQWQVDLSNTHQKTQKLDLQSPTKYHLQANPLFFPPRKMSHSLCHSPILYTNIPRLMRNPSAHCWNLPSAKWSVHNHNMLYIIKLINSIGYSSEHFDCIIAKGLFYLGGGFVVELQSISTEIRTNSVYEKFKRKDVHASAMEESLVSIVHNTTITPLLHPRNHPQTFCNLCLRSPKTKAIACSFVNNRFITYLHYCKKGATYNNCLPFWGGVFDPSTCELLSVLCHINSSLSIAGPYFALEKTEQIITITDYLDYRNDIPLATRAKKNLKGDRIDESSKKKHSLGWNELRKNPRGGKRLSFKAVQEPWGQTNGAVKSCTLRLNSGFISPCGLSNAVACPIMFVVTCSGFLLFLLSLIKCASKEFIGAIIFNDSLHQTQVFVNYCYFILELIISDFLIGNNNSQIFLICMNSLFLNMISAVVMASRLFKELIKLSMSLLPIPTLWLFDLLLQHMMTIRLIGPFPKLDYSDVSANTFQKACGCVAKIHVSNFLFVFLKKLGLSEFFFFFLFFSSMHFQLYWSAAPGPRSKQSSQDGQLFGRIGCAVVCKLCNRDWWLTAPEMGYISFIKRKLTASATQIKNHSARTHHLMICSEPQK